MISKMLSPTRTTLIAALTAFVFASTASAGIVIVVDNSNTVSVEGITGFTTTGNDMGGIQITATFRNGGPEVVSWVPGGGSTGGVEGNMGENGLPDPPTVHWSLSQTGDTYSPGSDNWTLTTHNDENELMSLLIEGLPGGVVFDRTFGDAFGTPNSFLGLDFDSSLAALGNITATYSDLIQIGANAAVGDLYGTLQIDFQFENPFTGDMDAGLTTAINNGVFTFRADTDTVGLPPGTVPEPGTLLLLGAGLVGAWYGRRRNS